ncbi:hypothetical protein AB0D08_08425 [Kitasatospora sp. NPDC048540]|uniref:hypothetical protein n=1 Tax=unclassified Kitasatospora TaxID=2633591 RepID=UPI00053A4BEF|nr:hypothetical protein [Kitasatospora sp. MBT63]
MPRNSRTPRSSRCTSPGSGRRPEEAFVTGILACPEDFERARPWGLTDAADHAAYLVDTAALLAEARRVFGTVQARMFHPGDFADFCLLHGLDPAEQQARDRYLVNPPLQTQLLPYQGEELADDFLPRLVRARESGLTLRHADLLLDGALCGPQEQLPPRLRQAHDQASEVFRRMLVGAGAGTFQFHLVVDAPGGRLQADARVLHWDDGVVRIHDEDLDLVCAVLCVGLARELPGAALLHGSQGSAGSCGEYRQVAWAWQSTGFGYTPAAVELDGVEARPGFSLGSVC